MPALFAGIHAFESRARSKAWMAGTSLDEPGHDDVDGSQPTIVGIIHCLTK
jgi:hypothetical protein